MGVTEEGDIYPIVILASPPLVCRPGWQTRTDRNATRDEAGWVTTTEPIQKRWLAYEKGKNMLAHTKKKACTIKR